MLRLVVQRRSEQVGLPGLHPHKFRYTFAHQWLAQDGKTDSDADRRLELPHDTAAVWRLGADAASAMPIDASPPPTGYGEDSFRSR